MNLATVMPSDATPMNFPGEALFDAVTLASSNAIRASLSIPPTGLIKTALPRFATRANPSVDNYMADLLLRSCYPSTDYAPEYNEHVIRLGVGGAALAEVNPSLVGAVLIGVGREAPLSSVAAIYDEHNADGTRAARAACEVVHKRHIEPAGLKLPAAYTSVLEEICRIDSEGNRANIASAHLNSVTKALHVSRLRLPGQSSERIYPPWKRAIVEACLTAAIVAKDEVTSLSEIELQRRALRFWSSAYRPRMLKGIVGKYWGFREPESVKEMRNQLLRVDSSARNVNLTMASLVVAMECVWPCETAHFLLTLLMEGPVQAQMTFHRVEELAERAWNSSRKAVPRERINMYPIESWDGGDVYHWVTIYEMAPTDSIPHRGIQHALGRNQVKGILIVKNPQAQTMAIFASGQQKSKLEPSIWDNFVEALLSREPDRWYRPINSRGPAPFILNGTESLLQEPSRLTNGNIIRIFKSAVRDHIRYARKH